MLFSNQLTLIRGGGDLATGVAYRLHKAGFPLIITELPQPLVVRRAVALAGAVLQGQITVEDLHARLVHTPAEAHTFAHEGQTIPILIAPDVAPLIATLAGQPGRHAQPLAPVPPSPSPVFAIVDARMAKRNIDTRIDQAPLVIALGPGFQADAAGSAGADCHAVVETMRGHRLGRVIWDGPAQANTGSPGIVAGKGKERVLRAPVEGRVAWILEIGDLVKTDQLLGTVNGHDVRAPFDGVIRGLITPGARVPQNQKIGDVDARGDRDACFQISDKALAIGGGVLEAILTHLNRSTS
jgi:xanthine dehydrogenase accessory factor